MSKSDGRCKECGVILALVGGRHRCIPGAAQALADARGREAQGNKRVVRDDRAARKSSAGGVGSRHAKAGNKAGSIPEEARCSSAPRLVRVIVQGAAIQPCAGVAPGPAEAKRKVGRPRSAKSLDAVKPWEAEGVSRRTWYYRRQAEKRGK